MTTVSEMEAPSIAQQVADLEAGFSMPVIAEKYAYDAGFMRGRLSFYEDQDAEMSKQMEGAKEAAEAYESIAKREIRGFSAFDQLRIGVCPHLGGVSILAILPESFVERLTEFRSVARAIEAVFWDRGFDFSIMTMATDTPDQPTVVADYPIFRTPGDA